MRLRSVLASLIALSLIAVSPGCTSMAGADGKVTDASVNTYLTNHETDIRISADITTVAVLATVKDDAKRADLARQLSGVADALLTAVDSQNLDLKGLRVYAINLLSQQDAVDAELAGLVVRSLGDLIESKNATFFTELNESNRASAIRSLIRSADGGVKQATATYTVR